MKKLFLSFLVAVFLAAPSFACWVGGGRAPYSFNNGFRSEWLPFRVNLYPLDELFYEMCYSTDEFDGLPLTDAMFSWYDVSMEGSNWFSAVLPVSGEVNDGGNFRFEYSSIYGFRYRDGVIFKNADGTSFRMDCDDDHPEPHCPSYSFSGVTAADPVAGFYCVPFIFNVWLERPGNWKYARVKYGDTYYYYELVDNTDAKIRPMLQNVLSYSLNVNTGALVFSPRKKVLPLAYSSNPVPVVNPSGSDSATGTKPITVMVRPVVSGTLAEGDTIPGTNHVIGGIPAAFNVSTLAASAPDMVSNATYTMTMPTATEATLVYAKVNANGTFASDWITVKSVDNPQALGKTQFAFGQNVMRNVSGVSDGEVIAVRCHLVNDLTENFDKTVTINGTAITLESAPPLYKYRTRKAPEWK
ncbi:MAG: hypothetical protein PHS41_10015 [Victivallaceae bacterium]|nr:hypothetical protein [Victivallaceae bacterium]